MDVYPQNLSSRYHTELVRRRAAKGFAVPNVDEKPPAPKLGMLGRFWAKGAGLTEEQAARAAPASEIGTRPAGSLSALLGASLSILPAIAVGASNQSLALGCAAYLALTAGSAALGYGPLARRVFRRAHRALSQNEVEEMIARSQDPLDRAYLELVRDAVRVETAPESAEKVREALEALGAAVEGLPAVVVELQDSDLLREQARELQGRAAAEGDAVVAESLLRQAESIEQRAQSHAMSAVVTRRATVLREEIVAKIAALRDVLAAQQTGVLDTKTLAALSESARSAARESLSAAAASDELERYLTPAATVEPPLQGVRNAGS